MEAPSEAASRRSQEEHAKFLIFQMKNLTMSKSMVEERTIVQCVDGSLPVPSLLLAGLCPLFRQTLDEIRDQQNSPVLILPEIQVGEVLLFLKYLLSVNVQKFFASEDLKIIRKLNDHLGSDFSTGRPKLVKQTVKHVAIKRPIIKVPPLKVKEPEVVVSDMPCSLCGESVNLTVLPKHMRLRHADMENACMECHQTFPSRSELEVHIQTHPNSVWFRTCNTCNFVCISTYQLIMHRKVHTLEGVKMQKCKYCDREFIKKAALDKHEAKHVQGTLTKKFSCVQCPKTFNKQSNLTRHIRSHFGIKGYPCDQCSAEFVDSTRLKEHKWIHLEYAKFKCPLEECQATFRHRSNLMNHMAKHKSNLQFTCPLCNRSFAFEYKLRNHLRVHKMEEESKKKERTEESVEEFKDSSVYVCATCKREFRSIDEIGVHCREAHNKQSNEEHKSKKARLDPPTTQAEIPLTSNNVTPNKIAVTVDSLTANVVDNTVNGCPVVNPGIPVLHHQPPSINTGSTDMPRLDLDELDSLVGDPQQVQHNSLSNLQLDAETKQHLQTLDDIRLENIENIEHQTNLPNLRLEFLNDLSNPNNQGVVDQPSGDLSNNIRLNVDSDIQITIDPKYRLSF